MKWIVDTDPGIDDAAALIAAAGSGRMDIAGVTTVGGNVPLRYTTRNALILMELMERDIPVFRGAERAIVEPPMTASEFHGKDGFGDIGIAEPSRKEEKVHAVDFIVESARERPGDLSLLTLGPLTNVALALAKDRSVASSVREIVMMGGTSKARGNASAVAEFNVFADPEAAEVVFSSGIPVTMVPWETCVETILGPSVVEKVRKSPTKAGQAFARAAELTARRIKARLGQEGLLLCDLLAACVAMDRGVATSVKTARVQVETGGKYSRGLTVIDERLLGGVRANATVCLACDREKVASIFLEAIQVS